MERQAHRGLVADFEREYGASAFLAESGNPPTPAWPAFKLLWLKRNDPEAYQAARAVLMPKDYINFRLTGEIAMDYRRRLVQLPDEPANAPLVARR